MTADDNVLLSKDPVARRVLLDLLEGCQDLREATARLTETVLCLLSSCGSPLWRVVSVRKSGGN